MAFRQRPEPLKVLSVMHTRGERSLHVALSDGSGLEVSFSGPALSYHALATTLDRVFNVAVLHVDQHVWERAVAKSEETGKPALVQTESVLRIVGRAIARLLA